MGFGGLRLEKTSQMCYLQHCKMSHRKLPGLHTGISQEQFGWGIVRLNLPEFIWLVSCSIVIEDYSFQYCNAMFLSYLHAVGAGRQAWLWKLSIYYTFSNM